MTFREMSNGPLYSLLFILPYNDHVALLLLLLLICTKYLYMLKPICMFKDAVREVK